MTYAKSIDEIDDQHDEFCNPCKVKLLKKTEKSQLRQKPKVKLKSKG
jgi:predicted Zn-dependent protease